MLKKLENFPGYLISDEGVVFSDKRKERKPLSPRDINGYDTVVMMVDGKQHVKYVHKLVAQELIPNDDSEKTQVIHKDGDKKNNHVKNLQWAKPGEGSRIYFQNNDTRRNKFDDTSKLPGTVLDGTSSYRVQPETITKPLSDKELKAKINGLSRKIVSIKSQYTRKIMQESLKFQSSIKQLENVYSNNPSKLKKEQKELEIQHKVNENKLRDRMNSLIKDLENQKLDVFKTRRELNKYFFYKDQYHKITDTGKSLIIRVKDENGNWKMLPVAEIILEQYLNKPRPTKKHWIGYKDFDYRNITPINMLWETPKEKSERYHKMFPYKGMLRDKKVKEANKSRSPEKLHDKIIKLIESGKNYKQVARMLKIPYYTLYRYCKQNSISSSSQREAG